MNIGIVLPGLLGKMRETRTVRGPDRINTALIRLQIQKLTGQLFIDSIFITVFHQPLLIKLLGRLAKMSGNAPDIRLTERRRHFLTAVGTGKAIHLLPNFFFYRNRQKIDPAGRAFFRAVKEFPEGRPALL